MRSGKYVKHYCKNCNTKFQQWTPDKQEGTITCLNKTIKCPICQKVLKE